MTSKYTIARDAWRQVAKTAHGVAVARSIAAKSLIAMDTASPRLAFDTALETAPNLRDVEGGHSWGTLELLGVKREEVPDILQSMGAPDEEIAAAVQSPEATYAALSKWAKAYRDPKPTQLPNIGSI